MPQPLTMMELERRMRPGQWSGGGFLGPSESLEGIISKDAKTLDHFGISYGQIANGLTELVAPALKHTLGSSPYPNLYKPETIPDFSLDNLPDYNDGYINNNWQVFTVGYRGIQECPWECDRIDDLEGSSDFLIINRNTGEFVTGSALIIHLIREHQFFEGEESPYRTDPERIISVLELDARK